MYPLCAERYSHVHAIKFFAFIIVVHVFTDEQMQYTTKTTTTAVQPTAHAGKRVYNVQIYNIV